MLAAVRKLAGILAEHGIEVSRATAAFTGCGREGDFPVGSLIVELAQPAKRLIRTILDADVPLGGDFLEEQERRRKRNLPDEIYDVTGWSLPQLFNVETVTCDVVPTGDFEPAGSERVTAATITRRPRAGRLPRTLGHGRGRAFADRSAARRSSRA